MSVVPGWLGAMSISGRPSTGGPVQVLAEVVDRVAELDEVLWSARTDTQLVASVDQIARLQAVLAAVQAQAVAETHARDLARKTLHYASTADWLTHTGGLRRGEGRRLVKRAQALTGPLARTRARMVAGIVSPAQADVIAATVADLPGAPHLRRRAEKKAEKKLCRYATRFDATDLAQTGRHLLAVVDPDRADRRLEAALDRDERAAHCGRFLAIGDDGAGGVGVQGRGSVEDGALIKAALLPLTTPTPAVDDPDPDPDPDPGNSTGAAA